LASLTIFGMKDLTKCTLSNFRKDFIAKHAPSLIHNHVGNESSETIDECKRIRVYCSYSENEFRKELPVSTESEQFSSRIEPATLLI